MVTSVLGAPGSGKTAVATVLRGLLPTHVILDWDAFISAAAALAGRAISASPSTWPAYRNLIRAVVDVVVPMPLVLLGVSTPEELHGWPIDTWVLLDCSDGERRKRLRGRIEGEDLAAAIEDGRQYRSLGLPVIDTTGRTPREAAALVAAFVHERGA